MHVTVDVGGRPGLDCGGFCSFCYFRGVKKVEPLGCRRCKPYKKGCDYCSRAVLEIEPGFKPLDQLIFEAAQQSVSLVPDSITIKGNGDVSFYPDLLKLIKALSNGKVPIFLDYTSGKGFTRGDEAEHLVDAGVQRISFSIFSTNPELRRKYVNDKHPEAVLANLRTFCEMCDLYAMIVLIPGVNDGLELEKTCQDLTDMGAKGLMLMSFANNRDQGLIFGNEPIMPNMRPFSVEEICRIATTINERYDMRVIGTPLWDPHTGAPFALAHHKEELKRLPAIERSATIVTSSIAYPLLSSIFKELGDEVNVVAVKKEIGNLITVEDFENLALDNVKERVIIPGMVLAHDRDIHRAFVRDGKSRLVFRGPDDLTVESERSIYMTQAQVLEKEIEAFTGLIEEINYLGIQIPELSHTPVSTKVGNMAYSCEIADTKRSVQASGKEKIELMV
jgi:methanogenesis marker radical SAM protein